MEETREKIELFRNYYLVCFRSFDQDPYSPTYLEPLNMYIIVFREGTLSFHFRNTPHPQNVRRRIKQLKDYINVTSDWISYALIDDITDAFGPLIQGIEYEVDSIDELVLILKDAEQSDMLRRIGTCRKKVMGLLRLMGNKADVVKGLSKRCNENWSVAPKSDIGLYLSDIQDHLITMTQNLNHYEKILSRSHSNYLAQISIEMTDANNQINDVLSKLTALGTIIVPMNVITGLWGMNVNVPGQGVENLRWFGSIVAGEYNLNHWSISSFLSLILCFYFPFSSSYGRLCDHRIHHDHQISAALKLFQLLPRTSLSPPSLYRPFLYFLDLQSLLELGSSDSIPALALCLLSLPFQVPFWPLNISKLPNLDLSTLASFSFSFVPICKSSIHVQAQAHLNQFSSLFF